MEDIYGGSVSFNLKYMSMMPPLPITNCYDNCLVFLRLLKKRNKNQFSSRRWFVTLSLVNTLLLTNNYSMCFLQKLQLVLNSIEIFISQEM